ncbi:Fe(3+)-hydroxamate ABC transporter permease FhuB [Providencia heimbachae]|uniref:Fe(3+)-hydroxamate ABC transporter permease FhuB n=1 Tax=Providencia heimbachae TaxID=333962 RepID=UPI0010BE4C1A|nr:Fe(3+)-hydroxamate ABC transporter permease FhuB [Providencia heimbachae]QCJ70563.1 Fe(3+)-hydroxamate ABC transporter permease FhuB [Providencia heimbachae]
MKIKTLSLIILLLMLLAICNLQLEQGLSLNQQIQLIFTPETAQSFPAVFYLYGQLPRLVIAILVGATLGLVGSLMQQLTQNNLTSPLTLGTSSGAWLGLVILSISFSDLSADFAPLVAMAGGLLAFIFVILITGLRNMTGLPLIVSGMVVNILLGAIATALITLNSQFAQNIFMWGAGDLTQDGWSVVIQLLPQLLPALFIIAAAPRILTVLRLGHEGAQARGLSVLPVFILFMVLATWLVAAVISSIGIIGFIGLLAPNIVRVFGVRTALGELLASALLGALLLLFADTLAIALSQWLHSVIPTGVMAAAIGAPALIAFSHRSFKAQDQLTLVLKPIIQPKWLYRAAAITIIILLVGMTLMTFLQRTETAFIWQLPESFQWALRWPRLLTALMAGIALAIAGTLLQRLIYNPLASPDILGVSSGATVSLIMVSMLLGTTIQTSLWGVALLGSLFVLALLLLLGRRHQFAPASLILIGISLTACLEAFVQFFLAQGTLSNYRILLWLSGSTYRVNSQQSLLFATAIIILVILTLSLHRWLTLLSIGRAFSQARGLHAGRATMLLLGLVALLCALVTATVGPLAFIGLVAPHMAALLGAQKVKSQLIFGGLLGATLMVWADGLGQMVIYPSQIAAGTLVAILGGSYFLILMMINRFRSAN